jgi:L-lactate dehydrogenase complex protein LldG
MTEAGKIIVLESIRANLAGAPRRGRDGHAAESRADSMSASATRPADQASLVKQFAEELMKIGGTAVCANTLQEAHTYIETLIQRHGAQRIALSHAPILSRLGLEARLEQSGKTIISLPHDDLDRYKEQLMSADLGITGVSFALADTGTLVLLAGEAEGRLASLLPPVHVAVLAADQIVATLAELFARVPRPPSSCMTFITGPSRTADIELTLTVGVHGPKELHVVVLVI